MAKFTKVSYWETELLKSWFDKSDVLVEHLFQLSATFTDVSQDWNHTTTEDTEPNIAQAIRKLPPNKSFSHLIKHICTKICVTQGLNTSGAHEEAYSFIFLFRLCGKTTKSETTFGGARATHLGETAAYLDQYQQTASSGTCLWFPESRTWGCPQTGPHRPGTL